MRFGPNLGRRLRISLRPPGPLEPLNFILDTYLRKEVPKRRTCRLRKALQIHILEVPLA